jgi:S1-C subfamily serine protease
MFYKRAFALMILLSSISAFAQKSLSERYQQWQCAVVLIQTVGADGNALESGTGFYVDDTTVVTAAHVIDHSIRINITNSKTETGTGVWTNTPVSLALAQEDDLARITVTPKAPCRLKLASSKDIRVGETLWGVGFPGYPIETSDQVLYEGLLTSRFHQPNCKADKECLFLRLQMPVTPGASGGPIINSRGEAVGIIDSVPIPVFNELKALEDSQLRGHPTSRLLIGGVDPNRTMAILSFVAYNFESAGSAFAVPAERLLASEKSTH